MMLNVSFLHCLLCDISVTDRNLEPGDNPLLLARLRVLLELTWKTLHASKPFMNQLGNTGILCPHRCNPHRIRTRDPLIRSHTPYTYHH